MEYYERDPKLIQQTKTRACCLARRSAEKNMSILAGLAIWSVVVHEDNNQQIAGMVSSIRRETHSVARGIDRYRRAVGSSDLTWLYQLSLLSPIYNIMISPSFHAILRLTYSECLPNRDL